MNLSNRGFIIQTGTDDLQIIWYVIPIDFKYHSVEHLHASSLEYGKQPGIWSFTDNRGPDTQKHLSSTYLSAVRVTAVKTT